MVISTLLAHAATKPDTTFKPITHWLFDNDGVNIDSEEKAMRVMETEGVNLVTKYVPDHGMEPDHIYHGYPGTSTDKIVVSLIDQFSLPVQQIASDYGLDVEAIQREQKSKYNKDISAKEAVSIGIADDITLKTIAHFKEHLTAIPGAASAVTEMRQTYGGDNVALCTTSREDRMDASLDYATEPGTDGGWNAGLGNVFPKGPLRMSGYEVENKYDLAFKKLSDQGFKPETTGVVEDSISGVTKAMANRPDVRVIGTVAATFYEDKDTQADALITAGARIVISDMADLPKAGQWLNDNLNPLTRPDFAGTIYVPASTEGLERAFPVKYSGLPTRAVG